MGGLGELWEGAHAVLLRCVKVGGLQGRVWTTLPTLALTRKVKVK